ncbi:MAG: AFG1 family ATPase [Alphaproteobacteria bacterium]|nr:AFG1 family ATPase [Alphaproteobacteria bacterium]
MASSQALAPTAGPLAAYESLLGKGRITADGAQRKLAERLQQLYAAIADYAPEVGKQSWLKRAVTKASKPPRPQGLYIWGDVGRGKSLLMDLFFEAVPGHAKRRAHFHAFMLDVHARIHAWRKENQAESGNGDPIPPVAKSIAEEGWLLCFDEFQVQDVADAMILSRLFGELFRLGVVVVATSNRPPQDLYQNGLQRDLFLKFVDLLKETLEIRHLDHAQDYRLKQLQAMKQLYIHPLGPEADRFLRNAFLSLTREDQPFGATLEMQGRRLTLQRAQGDVALASFHELCEQALGAADYLELARRFQTLLLSGIPLLTPEKRNEAKRFVTLIDALYEHKVKLICAAAAAPEKLYPEGDGSFEFQRTASRLIEMQSESYWNREHIG